MKGGVQTYLPPLPLTKPYRLHYIQGCSIFGVLTSAIVQAHPDEPLTKVTLTTNATAVAHFYAQLPALSNQLLAFSD